MLLPSKSSTFWPVFYIKDVHDVTQFVAVNCGLVLGMIYACMYMFPNKARAVLTCDSYSYLQLFLYVPHSMGMSAVDVIVIDSAGCVLSHVRVRVCPFLFCHLPVPVACS